VLLLALVALGVPLAISLKARVNAEVRTQAQAQADLVAATAADLLGGPNRLELRTLARTASRSLRGRVLVVDRGGRVLVDSAGPGQVGSSYLTRPEIRIALSGRQTQVQRHSNTLGQDLLATAVPIIRGGAPIGAVRVTQSISSVDSAVDRALLGLGLVGLIVLGLGLAAGAVIAAQVGRPIKRLEEVARRVSAGDLRARAAVEGSREQRSLARSFNDMTDRISRLLPAQRDFVADASHQLRTPLTGLRLRLEEARAQDDGRASADEIQQAIAEVDRLAHTVDELLALSRAGDRQLAGAAVDLHDLAASSAGRWRSSAAEREIELRHRASGGRATAWAAVSDIERALDALIENAVQYSPPGTAVTIASEPTRIEVLDRGRGIGEEEREAVFERFRRGHNVAGGPPGSGLGLAIARELVRCWGGEVSLAPRASGGTVAALELPPERSADDRTGDALPTVNQDRISVPHA
jgi:signal transduction histidine kinase